MQIESVCFVGAGTMGCFNALMAAAAGREAAIYDVSDQAIQMATTNVSDMAGFLCEQNFFPAESIPEALTRIRYCADLSDAIDGAQLVSESVPEQLALKRQVLAQLEPLCSSDTIITTNTSGLLVSDLEDVLRHGQRFAALHSHLASRLFDIVAGKRTSTATVDVLQEYVRDIGGRPLVLKKENPGYVLNAMLGPILAVAKVMVIEGLASLEDVDRAWMASQKSAIGPFGLMDLFGINVIFDSWQKTGGRDPALQKKVLDFIAPYIDGGLLGVKSSQGFYQYPEPAYSRPDFTATDAELAFPQQVLRNTLIESAMAIANNAVASQEEIDAAWCFAMSLEQGPFATLERIGRAEFLASHEELQAIGFGSREAAAAVQTFLG